MIAYRKIKDSMIYETEPVSVEVPVTPEQELDLIQASLDAAADAGTIEILSAGAVGSIPCCTSCGKFELREPTRAEHRSRKIKIQSPMETAKKKRGTCADLCVYNAALRNAKFHMGKVSSPAHVELLPHHRGPGKHHAITVTGEGNIGDPAAKAKPGEGCPICS